jgi:hypothetical protein
LASPVSAHSLAAASDHDQDQAAEERYEWWGQNGPAIFRALSPPELTRKLVRAGIPEQPWQTITADGTPGMHRLSLYVLARYR